MGRLTRDVYFRVAVVVSALVGGTIAWVLPLPTNTAVVVASMVGAVVGIHTARCFLWLRERRTRRGDLEYDYKRVR